MTDEERQQIVSIVEDYFACRRGAADLLVSNISPAADGQSSASPGFIVRVMFKMTELERESILSKTPSADRSSLAEFIDLGFEATLLVRDGEVREFQFDSIQLS